MKLATFDIFDTTLIRRCGAPETVFHLVAERLWHGDSMRHTEYFNLRRQAESKCRNNATIEEIYSQRGFSHFPDYSAEQIMNVELAVECDMLTVNPVIKEKIEALRKEGWIIKFLSDMYLPSEFLAEVLSRESCLKDNDEVIVSCEWDARKDDGALYRKVREKFKPLKWIHFGDNKHSDYWMARKNGIKASLVDYGFSSVERRLNKIASESKDGWKICLLTGASRTARIKSKLDAASALAADYIAALYIPFVLWVLNSARKRGIKRLHFLSRDGYIMQRIAEVAGFDDIELNYLFVSRKALMRGYLMNDSADRFVEVTDRQTLITQRVDNLLGRLQLDREKLKREHGIEFGYNQIMSQSQQQDFLNKLFENEPLTAELMRKFQSDGALTEAYLRQEGLADGTPQAMVDIGWLGTSRLMVNRILGINIPTYYVGVRADVYDRSCGDFDSYITVGQLDTSATGLIENYYSASPWPSTIGYERGANGNIMPKFAAGEKFTITGTIKINESGCRTVMEQLLPYLDMFDDVLLFRWAKMSVDGLSEMTDEVNLKPMMRSADFDGVPMVRKLNPWQLLNFVLAGARYTAFDRGSINVTLGHRLGRRAWRMHCKTAAWRSKMFRLIVRMKSK